MRNTCTPPFRTLLVIILLVTVCAPSFAQTFTISGTVKDDKSAEPLTNVVLILSPTSDTSKRQYGISELDGLFSIPNVAPGSYTLKTNYVGYQTSTRPLTVTNADIAL